MQCSQHYTRLLSSPLLFFSLQTPHAADSRTKSRANVSCRDSKKGTMPPHWQELSCLSGSMRVPQAGQLRASPSPRSWELPPTSPVVDLAWCRRASPTSRSHGGSHGDGDSGGGGLYRSGESAAYFASPLAGRRWGEGSSHWRQPASHDSRLGRDGGGELALMEACLLGPQRWRRSRERSGRRVSAVEDPESPPYVKTSNILGKIDKARMINI